MESTARTRRIAQGVLDYIKAHPNNHDQESWFHHKDAFGQYTNPTEENICDTTMCVAGTAIFLQHGVRALIDPSTTPGGDYEEEGGRLLGLNSHEQSLLFLDSTNEQAVDLLEAVVAGDETLFKAISEDDNYWQD